MGRSPCCDERGLKKGPWTAEEDEKLVDYIQNHGHGSWRALPKLAGLNRCGKSCRLRWTNYLRPDIKRGKFTPEEEQTILDLHSILGNKWSTIATHLPGRTDNEIKNFWNTHLKKKLIHMGFDPMTHRPRTDIFSSLSHLIALASLKELVDQHSWENHAVRLQTEAAQVPNNLQYLQYLLQPPISHSAFSSNILSSTPTDIDTFNLLNSLPFSGSSNPLETSILSSLAGNNNANSIQSVHDSIPFAHLPELQSPCSFQGSVNQEMLQVSDSNGKTSTKSFGLPSSLSPSPCLPVTSVTNTGGDACSSSSFDGATASIWPELLLDDLFFHDITQYQ